MSLQKFRQNQRPNYFLALLVFVMIVFGLIMIYSASVVESYELFGYNYFYLNKQAISFLIGIVCWFVALKIDYRFWQKNAFWLIVVTLVLLLMVYIPGIGLKLQGAARWVQLGPLTFQPSEIAKLTFILYLAAWFSKKGEGIKDFKSGFLPFALILSSLCLLILKEPDMGTTIVLVAIGIVMFYTAGASIYHIGIGAIFAGLAFWFLVKTSPYRWQRLMVFMNPDSKSLEAGYHINQSLLAIGSGGWFGLGFGQSKQKYLYLPETHIDSIFAIIVEELGFLRSSLVVLGYLIIGYIGFKIAKTAPDMFSKLVAVGITTWIIVQAFLNISTMLGIVPLTGVPLPFISYGGSALIISMISLGIIMNISKQCNR